nr:unnamed protein product [Callosobruchus analis]
MPTGGPTSSNWEHVSAMGYLALICFRLTVKDALSVESHIAAHAGEKLMNFFPQFAFRGPIPPPHAACYRILNAVFARGSPDGRLFLSYFVSAFWGGQSPDDQLRGFLRSACMLSLGDVGLGLISWVTKAHKSLGISLAEYLSYLYTKSFQRDLLTIRDFSQEYIVAGQQTWPWARIFNEGALTEISLQSAPLLTLTSVGICASNSQEDLWGIPQLSSFKDSPLIKTAKLFAQCLIDVVTSKIVSDPLTGEAAEFSNLVKARRAGRPQTQITSAPARSPSPVESEESGITMTIEDCLQQCNFISKENGRYTLKKKHKY